MSATAPVLLLPFFSPASFFSFSFVCLVSRPNFPRYCTPTLSLFSRTAIAALTYHRSHARRSNRGTQTRDPPFSLFLFPFLFIFCIFYFFLFCTFRFLVYSSATYEINFTYLLYYFLAWEPRTLGLPYTFTKTEKAGGFIAR